MKKTFAILLAVMMLVTLFPAAMAEEEIDTVAAETVPAEPAGEEIPAEVPVTAEPAAEAPAADEKETEEPAAEIPAAEQPAAEEPVQEVPAAEEPAQEAVPAAEEPAQEAPAAEEPAQEAAPAAEEPAQEVPAVVEPVQEAAPAAEEPAQETAPAAEEPAQEVPAVEEPAEEAAPVAEEPAEETPAAQEAPAAEEPVTEEPAAVEDVPTQEEAPVAEEPVQEVPAVEEPVTEEPAEVNEEVSEEPVAAEEEEETAPAFAGTIYVKLDGITEFEVGKYVTMYSVVENANMAYSVKWQRRIADDENAKWETIYETAEDHYLFPVTEKSGDYLYRAVLEAEDGTILISRNMITLTVIIPEEEPAEDMTAEQTEETETVEAETEETEETETEEPAAEEPVAEVTEDEAAEEEAEEFILDEDDIEESIEENSVQEIKEYETALGSLEVSDIPAYEYERDEEGNLVLDEKGNPVAIVPENTEIPVSFMRNEDGELILDRDGNPIVTQTVPADAVVINTLEDALNPDRTIDIYYSWNNEVPALGGEVTFIAVLYGYDNLEYTVQWQESADNANWTAVPEANELRLSEVITKENYKDFWRIQVIITDANLEV